MSDSPTSAPRLGFLGVGAQKAGTSTLNRLFRSHPDVELPATGKEVHYFDTDQLFHPDGSPVSGDYSDYHNRFRFQRRIIGEITPSYIYWAPSLDRIARYNPDIKLIVLLRNPIMRAYSQWGHNMQVGRKVPDFATAIDTELERLSSDPDKLTLHRSYVARGFYDRQLEKLSGAFPVENIFVEKSERFFAAQYEVFCAICDFLGVPRPGRDGFSDEHAQRGPDLPPMRRTEWTRLRHAFADDIGRLERRLGWDCADWLNEPPELAD